MVYHYDPSTGRVEGTNLPSASELVASMKTLGIKPMRSEYLFGGNDGGPCHACAAGMLLLLAKPELIAASVFDRHKAIRDVHSILGVEESVIAGIISGFDGDEYPVPALSADENGHAYGREVYSIASKQFGEIPDYDDLTFDDDSSDDDDE